MADYTTAIAPGVAPLLADGERLLAASPLIKDPGATEDVSTKDELVNLLDPAILLGMSAHPGELATRATFGRAVMGPGGSTGRRFYDALMAAPGPVVAVTDARLLIIETESVGTGTGFWGKWFGPTEVRARGIHEVPRGAILGAVRAPAGVIRDRRLFVAFTDGSGCSLLCAPAKHAGPVLEAIGAPHPDTGTENQ